MSVTLREKADALDEIDDLLAIEEPLTEDSACRRCDSVVEWRDDDPGVGLCDPCAQEVFEEITSILAETYQREPE